MPKIQNLGDALNRDDSRTDAAAILRSLIDEIRLIPRNGQLDIYLVGNLAAILDLCAKKHPGARDTGVQLTLVAGAGFGLGALFSVTGPIPSRRQLPR